MMASRSRSACSMRGSIGGLAGAAAGACGRAGALDVCAERERPPRKTAAEHNNNVRPNMISLLDLVQGVGWNLHPDAAGDESSVWNNTGRRGDVLGSQHSGVGRMN